MILLLYCLTGIIAGLAAGLFGVGGGIIVVPALDWIFLYTAIPHAVIMHMAAGTSLAVMIITTFASTVSHHRQGAVMWSLVLRFLPGMLLGVMIGALLAHVLSTKWLQSVFGILLLAVGIHMILLIKSKPDHQLPNKWYLSLVASVVGAVSGLLGVGSGMISVPYFVRCNVLMRNAVATSAATSLFIGIFGTLLFALTGHGRADTSMPWATGYIYWPAFLGIASFSVIAAPIGAYLSHHMEVSLLKRIFGVALVLVAVRMLF